tara:strand:- start:247 stop:1047 length:801 start_codon:yes stop_codon:yes gene_type:complete
MAGPWDNVDYEGYLAATMTEPEMHGLEGWCDALGIKHHNLKDWGKYEQDRMNIATIFNEIINRINNNSCIVGNSRWGRRNKGITDYLTKMHPINRNRAEWDPNFNVKDDNMVGGIMNRDLYSYHGIQQLLLEGDNSWDYANPPQNSIIYQYLPTGDGGGIISLNYISRIYDSNTGRPFMDDDDIDLDSTINWVWFKRKYKVTGAKYIKMEEVEYLNWNSCDPWVHGTGGTFCDDGIQTLIGFISFSQDKGGFFINWPTRPPQIGSV